MCSSKRLGLACASVAAHCLHCFRLCVCAVQEYSSIITSFLSMFEHQVRQHQPAAVQQCMRTHCNHVAAAPCCAAEQNLQPHSKPNQMCMESKRVRAFLPSSFLFPLLLQYGDVELTPMLKTKRCDGGSHVLAGWGGVG